MGILVVGGNLVARRSRLDRRSRVVVVAGRSSLVGVGVGRDRRLGGRVGGRRGDPGVGG